MLIPALILAERDRHRGDLSPEREEFIDTTIRDWIEEIAAGRRRTAAWGPRRPPRRPPGGWSACPPTTWRTNWRGHMFAQLAVGGGTPVVLEYDMPRSEVLRRLAELGADQVFISALAPFAYTEAREVCRDVRAHFPGMRIVVALWDLRAEAEPVPPAAGGGGGGRGGGHASGRGEGHPALPGEGRSIRRPWGWSWAGPSANGDTQEAETLLAEAERQIPPGDAGGGGAAPASAVLRRDAAAGRIAPEQERLCRICWRAADLAGRGRATGEGYRALAIASEEEAGARPADPHPPDAAGAGWSVVQLIQRAPEEGFDEAIASVEPHALGAVGGGEAWRTGCWDLAAALRREHPELFFLLEGPGFRPTSAARLEGAAVLVGADPRLALRSIESRLPPLPCPDVAEAAADAADARRRRTPRRIWPGRRPGSWNPRGRTRRRC